jgi:hypothetical protein
MVAATQTPTSANSSSSSSRKEMRQQQQQQQAGVQPISNLSYYSLQASLFASIALSGCLPAPVKHNPPQ